MTDTEGAEAGPRARDDVVFRRVDEDWLLFDPRSQEIHVLNLSAALAWSFCDGKHTEEEIAAAVEQAFRGASENEEAKTSEPGWGVRKILRGFREAGLLR